MTLWKTHHLDEEATQEVVSYWDAADCLLIVWWGCWTAASATESLMGK